MLMNQSLSPPLKVTLRIVEMYQKGELDSSVAMQLLGNTGGVPLDVSKKRPLEVGDTKQDGESDPEGESLDELLQQAKKAKLDPLWNSDHL